MNPDTRISLHTGNTMPVMALGTWKLTHDTAEAVADALALGYRMIDTSGDYGTQPGIAEGLRRSGVDRASVYVVTKVEETDEPVEATRRNLGELRMDYADLMLIHRPPRSGAGEELWRALIEARDQGLTRDIGVSNYSAEKIDALIDATNEAPAVNQMEWTPLGHSDDMLAYANAKGIIIQAYSPLTRATRLDDEKFSGLTEKYRKSAAQVMIRWNLQRGTIPLPKANQAAHRRENINVFDFELDEADMEVLNGLNECYSALGTLPYA